MEPSLVVGQQCPAAISNKNLANNFFLFSFLYSNVRKSNKLLLKLVKTQESSKMVKGKFPPLQIDKKIEVIEQIITFQSKKRHYPYVLFQGKSINFLGIVLSRQSSDLLNMIARKLIISMHFHGINLIQYYFPKELNSIKLIVLFKWENIDDFKKILSDLDEIQIKFDETLKKFSKLALDF
jgi:hypothetical protein